MKRTNKLLESIIAPINPGPENTLYSRRGHIGESIGGDAIIFEINESSTDPVFIQALKVLQKQILAVIAADIFERFIASLSNSSNLLVSQKVKQLQETKHEIQSDSDKMQAALKDLIALLDKSIRQEKKFWKFQKRLHASFLGTIPPSGQDEYQKLRAAQLVQSEAGNWIDNDSVVRARELLNQFLSSEPKVTAIIREHKNNSENPISLRLAGNPEQVSCHVKECKLNSDGHIVVRVTISQATEFMALKNQVRSIFKVYDRYPDDIEKQTTLAIVIGEINPAELTGNSVNKIKQLLSNFEAIWTKKDQNGEQISLPLNTITWVRSYRKRTLSHNNCMEEEFFYRAKL